jgi:predicted GNAT family N-acyltransferase
VVRRAHSAREIDAALKLRRRVFVDEQGVTLTADRDGRDHEAVHLVATAGDNVVGTLRLLPGDGLIRLGRMVVDTAFRGQGIGTRLLEEADVTSRELGCPRVVLHAQVPALHVYERAGYVQRGGIFVEQGIEHVSMEKSLA